MSLDVLRNTCFSSSRRAPRLVHNTGHMSSHWAKASTSTDSNRAPPNGRFSRRSSRLIHQCTAAQQKSRQYQRKMVRRQQAIQGTCVDSQARLISFGPTHTHSSSSLLGPASAGVCRLVLPCCALQFQWCQRASLPGSSVAIFEGMSRQTKDTTCHVLPWFLISHIISSLSLFLSLSLSFPHRSTRQAASSISKRYLTFPDLVWSVAAQGRPVTHKRARKCGPKSSQRLAVQPSCASSFKVAAKKYYGVSRTRHRNTTAALYMCSRHKRIRGLMMYLAEDSLSSSAYGAFLFSRAASNWPLDEQCSFRSRHFVLEFAVGWHVPHALFPFRHRRLTLFQGLTRLPKLPLVPAKVGVGARKQPSRTRATQYRLRSVSTVLSLPFPVPPPLSLTHLSRHLHFRHDTSISRCLGSGPVLVQCGTSDMFKKHVCTP